MKRLITSACLAGLAASSISAAIVKVSSPITSDTTWTASNEYVLTDIIFVRDATLTIEAGTIIRGEPKSGESVNDPGALVITRSGQIDAEGTPSNPIVFTTAVLDSDGDGQYSDESYDYASNINYTSEISGGANFLDSDPLNSPLTPGFGYVTTAASTAHVGADEYRGLWGGVIILGNAPTNIMEITEPSSGVYKLSKTSILARTDLDDIFEGFIEGLDPLDTLNNDGVYGGSNPNDSSGTFRYVSIRHGGTNIAADNEINGLTMAGVGAGTLIEFVEVYCNDDDGFEWFGGTVNTRYLVSLYNNDDSFDIDEGFTGLGQFWFSLQLDDGNGDHGGEHDGTAGSFSFVDVDSLNGTTVTGTGGAGIGLPIGFPTIYNATYVNSPLGDNMLKFDDSFGCNYYNSIFVGTPSVLVNVTSDAQGRVDVADCGFVSNSVFYNINGETGSLANSDLADYSGLQTILAANGNVSGTNPFSSLTNTTVRAGVDPRASSATPGGVTLEPVTATFFITASYAGAFDPVESDYWTDVWTVFSANVDNK
ncbi:MAG: hypothetical protein AAGB19_20135 [Cyanobacteria bacterium P01_F01_bin.3]